MPASPQPLSTFQAFSGKQSRGLALQQNDVSGYCASEPALYGCSIPYVEGEPDYSEHVVRCAWFRGMDGQHGEREVILGRPALLRDIPGAHSTELSYPSVLAGQVSLMQRLVRWQKDFMKPHESSFAMTEVQHWEYSLVKIAVGCVTDWLFLNYSRQYQDCASATTPGERRPVFPPFQVSLTNS